MLSEDSEVNAYLRTNDKLFCKLGHMRYRGTTQKQKASLCGYKLTIKHAGHMAIFFR